MYFGTLSVDTQQVVFGRHSCCKCRFRLVVQSIHLRMITFQHAYFTPYGDIRPIGIVGLDEYVHAGHAILFGCDLLTDTGQSVSGRDFTTRIDRLGQIDSGHIRATHTQLHSQHIHIGKHISTYRRGVEFGKERRLCDLPVKLRLPERIVRLLQFFAMRQCHFPTFVQRKPERLLCPNAGNRE